MLTEEGFVKKTYEEYLAELEQQARELFGADVNLAEYGPLGKFIRLQAYGRAEENELAEAIYLSGSVDNAEGLALDYVVKNSGMIRLQATKAIATVNLTVTPGKVITAGLIVSTLDGIEFVTLQDFSDADNNGTISATVEAIEAGLTGNVPANTITVINTPISGLSAVNNPSAATGGRDKETDKELRDRHADIGANGLSSSVNGIRSTILNDVFDTQSVVIVENSGNTTDAGGRPANSFEAIVYGGSSANIAAAILKAKPAGIKAHGSTTVVVKDDSGNDQTISFSFATAVNVWVKVDVTTDTSYPSNGDALVKTEVIKYIGGTDADGTKYSGLGMGQSVINLQVAKAVANNVPGITDAVVTFSTNGTTYAGGNVAMAITQVAQTAIDKVTIL
jgi:uncharacterized phage protein gp47/JayE